MEPKEFDSQGTEEKHSVSEISDTSDPENDEENVTRDPETPNEFRTETENLEDDGKTACSDSTEASSTSVSSNEILDGESSTPSEPQSYDLPTENESHQWRSGKGKQKSGLSARMEYLARPKKDFLDKIGFERLEGTLPERQLPMWSVLPLPTNLPVASYPYEITMTKLTEKLHQPPLEQIMDLTDENNLQVPMQAYNSLYDPNLKHHFKKKKIREHLAKDGFISKSGRVICSLKDINDYREYHRRILARKLQQKFRSEYEEEKRESKRKETEKFQEEEEIAKQTRTQTHLRSYIKNTVSSVHEGSMEAQRERDRKVLNRQIKLQAEWKRRAFLKQERYQRLFDQHMGNKYERDKIKKILQVEMARQDVEHLEEICRRREKEKLDRRKKLEDFWDRKVLGQTEWLEEGYKLEKSFLKEREEKISSRKAQAIPPLRKAKKEPRKDKTEKRTLEKILKDEEEQERVTLSMILDKIEAEESYDIFKEIEKFDEEDLELLAGISEVQESDKETVDVELEFENDELKNHEKSYAETDQSEKKMSGIDVETQLKLKSESYDLDPKLTSEKDNSKQKVISKDESEQELLAEKEESEQELLAEKDVPQSKLSFEKTVPEELNSKENERERELSSEKSEHKQKPSAETAVEPQLEQNPEKEETEQNLSSDTEDSEQLSSSEDDDRKTKPNSNKGEPE